ncbi:helix-turn-helix domain-containing protein [Allochromatium vinosum]|uniref:helix-turn-helix domain-containing protein n=1 Tax=Allochromatium vinosum TaxID=1049 RepID=UPI0030B82A27
MDSPELTEQIGQRLRAERKSLRLSLADLSERTGTLSKSRISNYEQGIRRMGLEEARILADALGTVTPAYLLCLEDTRGSESPEERIADPVFPRERRPTPAAHAEHGRIDTHQSAW